MIVCVTAGCVTEDEPKGPTVEVGQELPVFSVTLNNGEVVSTSSLKGKVPVIVFFNTDCSDCRKELPVIQQLWEIYRDNGDVKVVAIAREESEEKIKEYWEQNRLTMPYSPQETRDVYSLFAPSVIPRIYISNVDGVITNAYGDTDMPTLEDLKNAIETNLQ